MSIDTKLQTIAENQAKIYEAGYDKFWYNYQLAYYGVQYINYSFAGSGWNDRTFDPKHDVGVCTGMFYYSRIKDPFSIIENKGLRVFYSEYLGYAFANSYVEHVPNIIESQPDLICVNLNSSFSYSKVRSIGGLRVDENTQFSGTFREAYSLTDINIQGTINKNIEIQYSPLTAKSAKSIINALKDFTGTDHEYTRYLYFHSSVWTLLDAEGNAAPDGNTWRQYVNTTLKWNI